MPAPACHTSSHTASESSYGPATTTPVPLLRTASTRSSLNTLRDTCGFGQKPIDNDSTCAQLNGRQKTHPKPGSSVRDRLITRYELPRNFFPPYIPLQKWPVELCLEKRPDLKDKTASGGQNLNYLDAPGRVHHTTVRQALPEQQRCPVPLR